jgi:hypothetical protein
VAPPLLKIVKCIRCGHSWQVDLSKLGKPETTLYKSDPKLRQETFRLVCPNSGTVNMLDVTFKER